MALVALCISCQPELVSIEPVNQNTINITLDSWQHIESKYPKVANNIKQLKQQAQLNRYSSNYNFYINDSTVQVIEQPNYTTFTFFVYRDSITPNILENYTYKLYNDGTYQQFLLKYHYTLDQDLNKVFSQTHFDIEAIDDHSLLYGRTNSCIPEFETVQTGVVCTVAAKCTGGAKHEAGHPECICEDDPGCDPGGSMSCNPTYTVVYNSCGGGTNNGPDPNQNTNTTQGGNTQDPNSQPDPNNNSTIATPLEDTTPAWQGILDCINNPNLLETDTTTLDPDIFESLGLSKATYQAITNYLDENQCDEGAQRFTLEFFEISKKIRGARFDRYIELDSLLQENPWALIQDCAEQNGLNTVNYLDLYNLPFPQQCSDRLFNMGVEWHHQPITDGNVPLANIDYYAVEVTNYPDFDGDGFRDTEAQIYQAFREKFIDLASGEKEDFQYSCNVPFNSTNTGDISWEFIPLTNQDGINFVSNNPIASILLIEADATGLFPTIAADDGAVIVSDFSSNNWTISTIMTPTNGTQPFSGNRQWGWFINQNGNLEFFTRAVDVANISMLLNIGANTECQQDTYYNVAEATWENMQQEIVNWINSPESNGGQATIVPKTAVRVDKEKIEVLLTNNETINEINCE